MKLMIREQTCHLLAARVVYWEEMKTVILADIHVGKGTTFRKAGIPIPSGIMDDDLMNITNVINELGAEKCIIVGDLIHAKNGISEDVKIKFAKWLSTINCEVHLVVGNHDRSLINELPSEWSLQIHKEGLLIEPFYFSHYPIIHEKFFVWSGHLHPKVEISDQYDSVVLRCFQVFSTHAVLPAFGFFVGGSFVRKSSDCKIYAIAEHQVIEI
jgi:DNA ligase-associated metallophosphoesterase